MSIRRVFLGRDQPLLAGAVDALEGMVAVGGGGLRAWDLTGLVVVVPSDRARRQLLGRLAGRARERGCVVMPPELVAPQVLLRKLAVVEGREATAWQSVVAWWSVLRGAEAGLLGTLVRERAGEDREVTCLRLARRLAKASGDLVLDGLSFRALPGLLEAVGVDVPVPERYEALAELEGRYLERLAGEGLVDGWHGLAEAARGGPLRLWRTVVLLGVLDPRPVLAGLLSDVEDEVVALVWGDEGEDGEAFDVLGAVRPEAWAERGLDVEEGRLRFVEDAEDQVLAVVEAIEGVAEGDGVAADDVTVVAADGDLSEPIRAGLSLAGVRAAIVGSRGLAASGPAVLLGQLARFVETRGVDDLAVLVRHPDLDGYLRGVVGGDGDWAGLLDIYADEAFHRRLGSVWVGDDEVIARVKALYEAVMGLVSVEAGEERRLEGWVEVLRGVLRAVYGAREVEVGSVLAEEVEGLLDELDAVASLGQLAEGVPEVGFVEAVDWVLGGAEGAAVGLAGDEAAVPIVGVLEMAFDGAGVLVVAGLNEGSFPARPGVEPLLPMSVRKRLSLDAGEMREARDRWALEVAVRCRREVTLIAAGRSVNREPLLPSLVLLGGDRETRVVRLRRFLEEREHPAERLRLGEPGGAHRFLMIPPGREGVVLRRLGVTAFRDYLMCPYRFYLKYVEKLTAVEEEGDELGAARFGTLTHDVLKWLAEVDAKERGSLLRVERLLEGALEAEAAKRFGDDRSVAQRIQLESLRARLSAVARVQVSRWAAGWEIVAAERKLELPLEVDGEAVVVSGRIDRIDRHPEFGWQVLDYKTFGKITRKNEARGRHHTRDLVWSDLQLPLYLDLVRHSMVGVDEAVDAGYWILPGASSADVGGHVHLAGWDGEELASARVVRDEVVRRIVGGLFWPPGDLPVFEDGLAGLCGDGAADRAGLIARTTALMGGGA